MSLTFKVRPVNDAQDNTKHTWKGVSRVYISKESLLSMTKSFKEDAHCIVESLPSETLPEPRRRQAWLCAMPGGKNVNQNVVQMTTMFRKLCGFELGDEIAIQLVQGDARTEAETVLLREEGDKKGEISPRDQMAWEWLATQFLNRAEHVFPGMTVEVSCVGAKKTFTVVSVNGSTTVSLRFTPTTTVKILSPGEAGATGATDSYSGTLRIDSIPGYAPQIATLNNWLANFYEPTYLPGDAISCGFVLHGGPGTGRTFILNKLAATNWGRAFRVEPTDKLSAIQEIFKQARAQQPSMILVDDFEQLIHKDRANYNTVINFFASELDSLSVEAAATGSLPKVVVIITCTDYLLDIPSKLQKSQRFEDSVGLPVPDPTARLEILKSLSIPLDPATADKILSHLAQKTYAFSPSDLFKLVLASKKIYKIRHLTSSLPPPKNPVLTLADFTAALRRVKPTAMHDINLKPPTIHWSDIGGQEAIKKTLRTVIRNVTQTTVRRVNPVTPKGLLLYGPPGCSKTLSAQALATESGFNFFSVKGAELLDKYVGESEKAVRTLFARARAAAPCIIFFDEIDSLATTRSGSTNGAATRSTAATNVVTSLLTEMDGFESLEGVLIIGATNHPEAVDPALMRPGRFDKLLYVGPPDLTEREAIFKMYCAKMPVSEDVDFHKLAVAAEGYSGADIRGICHTAGDLAQELVDAGERGFEGAVKMGDLEEAIKGTPKSISTEMVWRYQNWAANRKRK